MPLTKTTTRAFAASLALVAVGGTIAGAAVFHIPILGLGHTDVASANAETQTERVVPAARKKVHPKVIVKTRYADVIVHVPASVGSSASPVAATASVQPAAAPMPPSPANETSEPADPADRDHPAEAAEPEATTTVPTTTTVAEHDDESEHADEHGDEDAPESHEHEDDARIDSEVHP